MESLLEYLELAANSDLEKTVDLVERELNNLVPMNKMNPTKVGQFPEEELNSKFEEAIKRLQAARNGLGLTNKLKNPDDRKKNRQRIMGNLNIIRAIVQKVEKALSAENQAVIGAPTNNMDMNDNGIVDGASSWTRDGSSGVHEDAEVRLPKSGINKKLTAVVKDEKMASHEVKKNPFSKKKYKGFKSSELPLKQIPKPDRD